MSQNSRKAYIMACHMYIHLYLSLSIELHHATTRVVTDSQRHRHGNYCSPHCACAPRVNKNGVSIGVVI